VQRSPGSPRLPLQTSCSFECPKGIEPSMVLQGVDWGSRRSRQQIALPAATGLVPTRAATGRGPRQLTLQKHCFRNRNTITSTIHSQSIARLLSNVVEGNWHPDAPCRAMSGGVGDVSSRAVARPMGWRPAFPLPCMTGSTPGQPQHAPSRAAAHDRIGAARGLPAMASRAGCADLIASGAYNRKSSARLSIPAAAPELPHSLGVNSEAEAEQEQEQRQKPMPHGACLLFSAGIVGNRVPAKVEQEVCQKNGPFLAPLSGVAGRAVPSDRAQAPRDAGAIPGWHTQALARAGAVPFSGQFAFGDAVTDPSPGGRHGGRPGRGDT